MEIAAVVAAARSDHHHHHHHRRLHPKDSSLQGEDTIDVERMDDDEFDAYDDCSSNDSGQLPMDLNRTKDNNGGGPRTSSSAGSGGSGSQAGNNRSPTCALCKNHGLASSLKGHKRYCPYGKCGCESCRVTRRKQKINADQVSKRRAFQQDRELGIVPSSSSSSSAAHVTSTVSSTSLSGSSTPRTVDSSPLPESVRKVPALRPSVISSSLASASSSSSSSATTSSLLAPPPGLPLPPFGLQHHQPVPPPASGPALFGENLYLECFLLVRNSSLLGSSLRMPTGRLNREQLVGLEHDVRATVRVLRGEVSGHLADIHTYLFDRLQRMEREQLQQQFHPPNPHSFHGPAALKAFAHHQQQQQAHSSSSSSSFSPYLVDVAAAHQKMTSPMDPCHYSNIFGHSSRDVPALYTPFGTH